MSVTRRAGNRWLSVKWIRKNPMGIALVLSSVMLIVLVALFIKGYRDVGANDRNHAANGVDSAEGSARSGARGGSSFFPSSAAPLPRKTLTPGSPGGFVFGNLPTHELMLTVNSATRIGRLGYLVPTSPDASYGDLQFKGSKWSLGTKVVGKPNYAAIFVQAGATGTPITCTVTVDGVVRDKKTTSGAYGRAVCVG